MNTPTTLYRYDDYPSGVVLLNTFRAVKETPSGVWIDAWGKRKFVNLQAVKQFANRTEEEAKAAFFARKRRQVAILKAQLESVQQAVEALKAGRVADCDTCFQLLDLE